MVRKIYNAFPLMVLMMASLQTFAQTINYQTWSAPSLCNIFSGEIIVNGIPHTTTIGQPRYDGTNKTINLECTTVGGNKGTEYRIAYPFKQGFSYQITVRAVNIKSNAADATSLLRLDLSNSSNVTNTLCTGMQAINASPDGGLKRSQPILPSGYIDYYFDYLPVLTSNYSYLLIGAIPASSSGLQTILIRSITITETAVSPELTLSPTSVSTVCGSPLTQAFTVSNPHNVSGITSYEWNLGSANNGWIYNGNPAPQNISTTGNSITLTADACRNVPLANVTVTVKRNGTNYKTYSASTQTSLPANLSIVGPDNICSGSATYTLNNIPCNALVTWSRSPATGNLSCTTCPQTTYTMAADATITLTASLQLPCHSTPITLQKTVKVGIPSPFEGIQITNGDAVIEEPFVRMISQSLYLQLSSQTQYGNFSWTVDPGADPGFSIDHYAFDRLAVYYTGSLTNGEKGTARLTATHPQCGTVTRRLTFYILNEGPSLLLKASPVPASNTLTLSLESEENNQGEVIRKTMSVPPSIKRLQIIDMMGNIKIDKTFPNGTQLFTVDVSGLKDNIYIIRAYNGKDFITRKVVVRR